MLSYIANVVIKYLHDYLIFDIGKVNICMLSKNTHPDAVRYLLDNERLIYETEFSANNNSGAVQYMIDHPNKIDSGYLSKK